MVVAERSNKAEIAEQDSLLLAMYSMRDMRVVDLQEILGGDSNQKAEVIIDEKGRDRWVKKHVNTHRSKAQKELKHLKVLRMALIYMLMCELYLYECAKKNSGTVGLTVWNVECPLINVVGPVYQKFKGVPDDFLSFLGTKIDEAADRFDRHAPPLAKEMMYLALVPIQRAFQKTKVLVNKAQTGGLRTAIHCAATEYKQILFKQSEDLGWTRAPLPSNPEWQRRLQQQLHTFPRNTTKL